MNVAVARKRRLGGHERVDTGERNASTDGLSDRSAVLAALLELVAAVSSADCVTDAAQLLARQLSSHFDGELVLVARLTPSGTSEVLAAAGPKAVSSDAPGNPLRTAVLDECIARGQLSCWPVVEGGRHALFAHRRFVEQEGLDCVVSVPLRDARGRDWGVCLIAGRAHLSARECRHFLAAGGELLGSALRLIAEGTRSRRNPRLAGPQHALRRKTIVLVVMLAAVVAILAAPFPYRVKARCELQPVVRRFVAAPFDGRLEATHVEPGDMVQAGQTLAQIDGREIRAELSSKQAQRHQVLKERAGYLATHQSGQVEILNLESQRLQLEIARLQDEIANLDIRSDIAGLVIAGDLTKSEGVPLEQGKTLFEIAPLDQMVVEVAIPESDVSFVKPAMATRLRLDAFPMRTYRGRIERIHPRAELRDHGNVFMAEVMIDNHRGILRPGMRGTARIPAGNQPLAWILFHDAVASALTLLGW